MRRVRGTGSRGMALAVACAVSLAGLGVTGAAAAAGRPRASGNWPAYLRGPSHTSFGPGQTAITPRNARNLRVKWRFFPNRHIKPNSSLRGFLASPTVVGDAVYIGASSGWFYKLNASTGRVLAKRFIGYQPKLTCPRRLGVVSTATVQPNGKGQLMVYVGGPDGYLYALRASNLSVAWRSVIAIPSKKINNFFQWSSPTVAGGRIFIGIASNCDEPLVRAGLVSYSQATGRRLAVYRPLPRHLIGASIWSSAAIGPDGDVYVTTGNAPSNKENIGRPDSITKLNPRTLRAIGSFKVPRRDFVHNGDFGSSPTIFGHDVGACNKNGRYYAVNRATMRLAWKTRVGVSRRTNSSCVAAAAYDGHNLYVAGPAAKINGRKFNGSVKALNPKNGAVRWRTGLPNGVVGTPTVDGAGVLAVGTFQSTGTPDGIYLLNAATGAILTRLTGPTPTFAQSVFARRLLYTATGASLTAWQVRSGH